MQLLLGPAVWLPTVLEQQQKTAETVVQDALVVLAEAVVAARVDRMEMERLAVPAPETRRLVLEAEEEGTVAALQG